MADTALSIITDAYAQTKIYAPGVQLNAADSALGLSVLNEMLDEWSNDNLACYANLEQSIPLQAGKQAYTIGTSGGADIVGTRPLDILQGQGAAYLVDSNQNRYPINVIQQDQWNTIGRLTNTSQLPDTLFYDPQFPLGILNVFPMPSIAYTIYFDSRLQLVDMTNLNSSFNLPPGYRAAIKNNLCIRLWPYFKQGDPSAILIGLAMRSLGTIKRKNIKQSPSSYDSAVVSKAKSSYNIYNDASGTRGNS